MDDIKIGIVSDLHTEFWSEVHFDRIGSRVQFQLATADLILLAGDIDSGSASVRTAKRLFPAKPVCLVAGNHEFYQRDYALTLAALREEAVGGNINFLHRDCYTATINEKPIRVLGATLWTDFALLGTPDLSMLDAQRGLNDFRLVRHDGHILTPHDTLMWHREDKAWLLAEIAKPFEGITVVMVHHAPVNFAVAAKFVDDWLSPCFASRLEADFARDTVDLVVWGHTHHSVDQMLGTTRFVSNQTGYPLGRITTDQVETNDFGIIVAL